MHILSRLILDFSVVEVLNVSNFDLLQLLVLLVLFSGGGGF